MVTQVVLPDEAHDVTASELHQAVLYRLVAVLRHLFGDSALVLSDIFLRVDNVRQVAPDVLVVPGSRPGKRKVYRVPNEPVPVLTLEVLSEINYEAEGRGLLAGKRALLGAIGVPTHIEIDPDNGFVTTWRNTGSELVIEGPADNRYEGAELAGLRMTLEPGVVRMWLPDGREFIDAGDEITARAAEAARADAADVRADAEAARADAEASRAARLAEALRQAGVDPDTV
jgi:Uma2 family endonuclease